MSIKGELSVKSTPPVTPVAHKQPRILASNAAGQHTVQILAIAPLLIRHMRAAYLLSSPCLSMLYACAAIQIDKSGQYGVAEIARLCGLSERNGRQHYNKLEEGGYVQRIGGRTTWRHQKWQLTGKGWDLAKDAAKRAISELSYLSIDRE